MPIVSVFTCTRVYAVLIMSGLERVESCDHAGMWQLPKELSAAIDEQLDGAHHV
jgi:hypothetical protein